MKNVSYPVLTQNYQWLIMPDSPETATWLTEKERAIAVARMAEDQLGVKNGKLSCPTCLIWALDIDAACKIPSNGTRFDLHRCNSNT